MHYCMFVTFIFIGVPSFRRVCLLMGCFKKVNSRAAHLALNCFDVAGFGSALLRCGSSSQTGVKYMKPDLLSNHTHFSLTLPQMQFV